VRSFKRYRDIAIVVLLLAVPFFFLRASVRRPEDMNAVDRALMTVAAPLEYVAAVLARGVSRVVSGYVYLLDVKEDNNRLVFENARPRSRAFSKTRRLRPRTAGSGASSGSAR